MAVPVNADENEPASGLNKPEFRPLPAPDLAAGQPGPDWWKASDGNWYPPESRTDVGLPQAGPSATSSKSADERKALLARAIAGHVAQGGRIESQSDFQAVLVFGKPVNHVLHLIITLVTCLIWGIVWIVLVASAGESRKMIEIDAYGNVVVQRL